jgi:catechol 2,3-dioxygenase-like lactoylglutathione lyase family enzyme
VALLRVADCDGSVGFYTELLGFEEVERVEEEGRLVRARIANGAAELELSEHSGVQTAPGAAAVLKLFPDDVGALHSSLVDLGATVSPLARDSSGARSFELVDPDGYELSFAEVLPA